MASLGRLHGLINKQTEVLSGGGVLHTTIAEYLCSVASVIMEYAQDSVGPMQGV